MCMYMYICMYIHHFSCKIVDSHTLIYLHIQFINFNKAWGLIFYLGFAIYLGRSNYLRLKVELCKVVVSGLLFVLWYYIFPDIAGEDVVITSYHKVYMILLWGMTYLTTTFIAVIVFGSKIPKNEPVPTLKRACVYSIVEMVIIAFVIGTILLNNLELSQEAR